MRTLWITYAWEDNRDRDIDFIAQELIAAGVHVKLDRWTIRAGRRLWDQIAAFISEPQHSDAWMIYATQASLGSKACREELAYALDRALNFRGDTFPVIAVFPQTVDRDLIPPSIRVRLFVSLADPDWKERIVAAVEQRDPSIEPPRLQPYVLTNHPPRPPFSVILEVRPRAGVWYPFMAAVPPGEREQVGMAVRSGPRGQVPPIEGVVLSRGEGISDDGQWFFEQGWDPASPTNSYYLFFRTMPSRFAFGQPNTPDQMFIWNPGQT
jgi:hypothetical protein